MPARAAASHTTAAKTCSRADHEDLPARGQQSATARWSYPSQRSRQPIATDGFQRCLSAWSVTASMSRKGNPYDNALAESFVATLKTECFGVDPAN